MIHRLRVILAASEDCFRDIEIDDSSNLEDLHNVIVQSFQLQGDEMASFYKSDEDWNQGEEYVLYDMSETGGASNQMQHTTLENTLSKTDTRLIYIYDFLSMWTFLIELADVAAPVDGTAYPQVIYSIGELPDEPPAPDFEADPRFTDGDEEFRENLDGGDEFYDQQEYDDNEFY